MNETDKKLTIRVSDEIHTKLKVLTAYKHVTITDFVVEAIKEKIERLEKENS